MKIFIFNYLSQVSNNYHPEGGLVIIAENKEKAIDLISENKYISISESDWTQVEEFELSGNPIPKYWVMKDAGCC